MPTCKTMRCAGCVHWLSVGIVDSCVEPALKQLFSSALIQRSHSEPCPENLFLAMLFHILDLGALFAQVLVPLTCRQPLHACE